MNMEKIQLYKTKKLTIRFLLGAGVFFILFGTAHLIFALMEGFGFEFPGGDWMSIFFIIQGALFCISAYSKARRSRYFISLDTQELSYLLPKQKTVISIAISDIEQLKMDGIEIIILAKVGERKIRLKYIELLELNDVKALVDDLSLRISENNV